MVSTLEKTKRSAIAEKLADMRAIQNLLIANEEQFLNQCDDREISDRLQDMLEDDRKNLEIIETVITQFGVQSKPKDKVQKLIQQTESMMKGSELNMYEKIVQHELLKHGQVISGLVVHKAAQVSEPDVMQALSPLNTINFDNRAHQEQLKGILEILGTRELTGKEPEQGIWGRVQDSIAAATGALGSAFTRTADELDVLQIIRTDHTKAKTLIGEIRGQQDPGKLKELFSQLYADLSVHAEAEEEVVYPKARDIYGETQQLYDEQAELKKLLKKGKSMNPTSPEFKPLIMKIKQEVDQHTSEEETGLFFRMRQHMSSDELKQLGREFKESKKQLETKMSS
ncbi:MAG: hemerythrin domain-containing protein [Oscillatoria sp. PMC 1051.18]|nr:hemerythrin domain-containing protein [Oscillatoria sp. PMC 1050.18]MEC5032902.1 hemerythrin domain-containing protein [Oscillatoria sp. PMC 1051.18]